MSRLNDLLDAIVADHVAAALQIGGNTLTIVKRKLPKKEETVDADYQVSIYAEPISERSDRIANNTYLVKYFISMTLITPNDRDALVNLVDHAAWRESTRARYEVLTTLGRIDFRDAPFLDRTQLAEGYDYQTIAITIWSFENR